MSSSQTDSTAVVVVASVTTLLLTSVMYVGTNQMPITTHQRTRPKVEYPRFASAFEPAGNACSVAFLKWSRVNGISFDAFELDDNGDIVNLVVHVCYVVGDQDLQVIAKLPRLQKLMFVTEKITDSGLAQLEATTTLRKLTIYFVPKAAILDGALERLKTKNPELVIKS